MSSENEKTQSDVDVDTVEEADIDANSPSHDESAPALRKRARVLLGLGILGGGMGLSALLFAFKPEAETEESEKPVTPVEAMTVSLTSVPVEIPSQGIVAARTVTRSASEVSGRVIGVDPRFEVGGEFAIDEVILSIDDADYQAVLASARAEEAQARLALATEEGRAKKAKRDWEKIAGDETPTSLAIRVPQMASAQAALKAATAGVEKALRDVERCTLKAPYPCRIVTKHIDIGSFAAIGTPLADLESTSDYEVRLPVPLEDFAFVELPDDGDAGKMPKVTFSATVSGEDRLWAGRVLRDEGGVDRNSRSIYLVAGIRNSGEPRDRFLQPGLFVRASVEGVTLENVVEIPRRALREDNSVLVINDENLHFRDVAVKRTTAESALVSTGLESGERICLTPVAAAVEGMAVKVIEPSTGEPDAGAEPPAGAKEDP